VELDSLEQLYVKELRDLYSAEKQILKALPRMIRNASNTELQRAFRDHERATQKQVQRLDRIFRGLGVSSRGKKCEGMEGLLAEGAELIKEKPDEDVLDAGLIAAAQRVEHYEMAGYGTVRTYARLLGHDDAAELLQETLDEEGEADKRLTELAERSINIEAMNADEDEQEVPIAGKSRRRAADTTASRRDGARRSSGRGAEMRA
jgi:ferritin-like metal-binding protein YciE